MHQKQFYVGVDWASQSHHVCVLKAAGDRLGEQVFKHTGEGLARMAGWILKLAQSEPELVQVAIEVPHGPVVESSTVVSRSIPSTPVCLEACRCSRWADLSVNGGRIRATPLKCL